MQISEETKQNIEELALLYKECLLAASEIPPSTIIKHVSKTITAGPAYALKADDYHHIATSIFIELNRQRSRQRGHAPRTSPGADTELSTDKQQAFIGGLAAKLGKKGENIIIQFLDNNEVKLVDKLSKSQATTLINLLQEEQ